MTTFTKAQKRALLALPADGSWLVNYPRAISSAVESLYWHALGNTVELQRGFFGPRGGHARRARLTPAGIKARKALEATP